MNNDAARFGRQYKTYAVLFERKITSISVSPTIKTVWCKARKNVSENTPFTDS